MISSYSRLFRNAESYFNRLFLFRHFRHYMFCKVSFPVQQKDVNPSLALSIHLLFEMDTERKMCSSQPFLQLIKNLAIPVLLRSVTTYDTTHAISM